MSAKTASRDTRSGVHNWCSPRQWFGCFVSLLALMGLMGTVVSAPANAATSSVGSSASTLATAATPTGNFYVVGKDIIDPSGKVFYPVGFNVGVKNAFDGNSYDFSKPAYTSGWAYGDKNADAALEWGVNVIRPNYLCTNDTSYSTRLRDGLDTLKRDMRALVATYTARHIVVMLECHDSYTGTLMGTKGDKVPLPAGSTKINSGNKSDVGKTTRAQMDELLTWWGTEFGNNPYVWFNPHNEPFAGKYGSNDPSAYNVEWQEMNQRDYGIIRKTGAENIMVADATAWGQDSGTGGAKRLYDPAMLPALVVGRCNVIGSVHDYSGEDYNRAVALQQKESISFAAAYDRVHGAYYQKMVDANLPLIVGEGGYTNNNSSTAGAYAANKAGADWDLANLKKYGYGFLVWNATFGADNYSLKSNSKAYYVGGASAHLSDFGKLFWDYAHSARPTPKYTGNLAASNCASAKQAGSTPVKTTTPSPKPTATATPAPAVSTSAQAGKAIDAKFASLPASVQKELGYKLGSVKEVEGGFVQTYGGGAITWSKALGAHFIKGAIYSRWKDLGSASWGLASGDEGRTKKNGVVTSGFYTHFRTAKGEDRSIYWKPGMKFAGSVQGAIRSYYGGVGWENSSLGYPTSREIATVTGVKNTFEHGTLYWSRSTGKVTTTPPTK